MRNHVIPCVRLTGGAGNIFDMERDGVCVLRLRRWITTKIGEQTADRRDIMHEISFIGEGERERERSAETT